MGEDDDLKVLVVDDSALYRKIIQDILGEIPGTRVVGTAQSGKIALAKIAALRPHVLTLDLEMPDMGGLEVLRELPHQAPDVGAIIVSSHTKAGAASTIQALELGAFDFVTKPDGRGMADSKERLKVALAPMLEAFDRVRKVRQILKQGRPAKNDPRQQPLPPRPTRAVPPTTTIRSESRAVAIAVSTGGPAALTRIIPRIPADIGVPIFIVQHMPAVFTAAFASRLNSISTLEVLEADDGMPVLPGTVYLAPGGRQMRVRAEAGRAHRVIGITDDPPENNCRPSADYLFRSVAEVYGRCATGVIMTGMGSDGTKGLKLMKARGATIIAQDESSSIVYSMPKWPVEAGIVDVVAPLDSIPGEICRTVKSENLSANPL